MWQLVINGPGYFDTVYDLPDGTTSIGRADENDVVLSGDLVSRRHARFHVQGEMLSLEDLGSRNGTRLNNELLAGTLPLKVGDTVVVGENALFIRQPSTGENATTEVVDIGAGGAVRRFGSGAHLSDAVVLARGVKDSSVLRALDNLLPFESSSRPHSESVDEEALSVPAQPVKQSPSAPDALVLLFKVAEHLATAPSLQALLDTTTDLLMTHVGATTGVVLLRHASGVFVPSSVRHASRLRSGEVPVSDAIVEAVLEDGRAIAVADVRDDQRFADRESVVLYGVDQVLCIPIGSGPPWSGVLYLNRPTSPTHSVEALLDVCTAITHLLQAALHKHQATPPEGERLRHALERFFSPEVAARHLPELANRSSLTWLEERQATVLVADLSSAFEAGLDLDRLGDLLAEFLRLGTQICLSFDGVVVAANGASLVAVFGMPTVRGDDAIRAVRTAIALRTEWTLALAQKFDGKRLEARVGLHTGLVIAGTMGNAHRLEVAAFGDPVPLATSLSASASPGQILMTGKTLAMVGARFDVKPLGERPLRGPRGRTAVFEVSEEDSNSNTVTGARTSR